VPDSFNPQAFNRYTYVYNNPITYVDPSGNKVVPIGEHRDWLQYMSEWLYECENAGQEFRKIYESETVFYLTLDSNMEARGSTSEHTIKIKLSLMDYRLWTETLAHESVHAAKLLDNLGYDPHVANARDELPCWQNQYEFLKDIGVDDRYIPDYYRELYSLDQENPRELVRSWELLKPFYERIGEEFWVDPFTRGPTYCDTAGSDYLYALYQSGWY
jgi:hypothetical protein